MKMMALVKLPAVVSLSLGCVGAFAADLPLRPAKPLAGQQAPEVAPKAEPKTEPKALTPAPLPGGQLQLPGPRIQDSEKLVPENDDVNLLADPRCYHWSDGCKTCQRSGDRFSCSNPGIACQPTTPVCTTQRKPLL